MAALRKVPSSCTSPTFNIFNALPSQQIKYLLNYNKDW